jgi:hypothetical protein
MGDYDVSDRKVINTGYIDGTYGRDEVRLEQLKRGRFAGRFVTRGGGYAGRVAYASMERAMRSVEADVRFAGWAA